MRLEWVKHLFLTHGDYVTLRKYVFIKAVSTMKSYGLIKVSQGIAKYDDM